MNNRDFNCFLLYLHTAASKIVLQNQQQRDVIISCLSVLHIVDNDLCSMCCNNELCVFLAVFCREYFENCDGILTKNQKLAVFELRKSLYG